MKRVFAVLLCLAVMCGAAWGAYYDEGNDGNSWETAYVIDSAEDFMLLRERAGSHNTKVERGKYYKITADLDVSAQDMNKATYFYGHLDGQNHTIKVNIQGYSVFFEVSADQVAIRNLNVTGNVRSSSQAAGIVYLLEEGSIENSSFTGTVEGKDIVGGILVSVSDGASVKNCTFSGNIVASGQTSATAGGIAAQVMGSIDNCTVSSGTTIACNAQDSVSNLHAGSVGGIAGMVSAILTTSPAPSVTNCTSYAVLEGNVEYKGGIAGIGGVPGSFAMPIFSGNTWPDVYPQIGTGNEGNLPTPNIPTTPNTPTTSPDTPATPDTISTTWNNHKYTLFDRGMTWTEAKAYCESLGGHLATITSQEEHDAVVNMLSNDEGRLYWLGASDTEQEGSWKWVTSENFTFTKWHSGEPNNQGSEEHYLVLTKDSNNSWGWNDATNSHMGIDTSFWSFICEWDPEEATFAPLNSDYTRYIETPDAYLGDSERLGGEPSPLELSHLANNPPITDSSARIYSSASPSDSEYDPRQNGRNFRTRYQGNDFGTCWVFATIGALEASYTVQDFGEAPDLSRLHMAWYVYKDKRPGMAYEMTIPPTFGSHEVLCQGGSSGIAISFLKRAGTAYEKDLPYPANLNEAAISRLEAIVKDKPEDYSSVVALEKANHLSPSNRREIKEAVLSHGAVAVSYFSVSSGYGQDSYYYNTDKGYGHMVDIVGWNDNYSASNFANNPGSNGAWLIKDSYPHSSNGYFWMSYAQKLGDATTFIASDDLTAYKVYGHDSTASATTINYHWSANVFKAENGESLRKVGFHTRDNNVHYEVYVNKHGTSKPEANPGTPSNVLASGTMPRAGYHIANLNSPIELSAGEYFSVIVKFINSSEYPYYSAVEDAYSIRGAAVVLPNESYFAQASSTPNANTWIDGSRLISSDIGRACNACISAYTIQGSDDNTDKRRENTPVTGSGGGGGGCSSSATIFTAAIILAFTLTKKK